jgi:AraC family transcriptional activator FtrA
MSCESSSDQKPQTRLRGVWSCLRIAKVGRHNSIASLADKCGMSAPTFQRRFRETTGIAPGEWLVTERVRLAQEQLERTGRRPLTRIAERCGFGSVETMRHHFRSKAGVSPASYRKRFASG